ncbi:uncharacterized protein LOC131166665 [Malania oleifera]|uniref:uncharacterized protein LOC131166665 n=1 Tax=Malania oleifera TaxID=397392 RepID=UPI0025ADDAB6|nr:uncharacterized protein LOC131166665 [Malania oleifera]
MVLATAPSCSSSPATLSAAVASSKLCRFNGQCHYFKEDGNCISDCPKKKAKDARDALKARASSSSKPIAVVSTSSSISAPSFAPSLSSLSVADLEAIITQVLSRTSTGCDVQDSKMGQLVGTGRKVGRLFEHTSLHLPCSCSPPSLSAAVSSSMIETQFARTIKVLRFDNALEYTSTPFIEELREADIIVVPNVSTITFLTLHASLSGDPSTSAAPEPGPSDDPVVTSTPPESTDLDVRHSSRPRSYREACSVLVWQQAMSEELDEYGIDYEETFAPVARITSVCSLLDVASTRRWPLFQMDVKNAFLHGELTEKFEMKDLSSLRYLLGLKVSPTSDGNSLTQAKYASDFLTRSDLTDCKITDSPLEPNIKLHPIDGELLPDVTRYQQLIGSLIYFTVTRPDIAYVVHLVSQFLSAPRSVHYVAILRILRYVKGTLFHGLFFPLTYP